ncbi:MAG: C-terminal target protein [Flavipsychrobacter sp.]|nr:C-terminal target protein [Flavipsychrobacter sp.]
MMRKLTLLFLLCIGLHTASHAQVRDTVRISIPMFSDTTCPGTQITFTAIQSNDTFSNVSYKWYTNSFYTGVTIDTFKSTALNDGDSVYCVIYFTNSFGLADSFRSNVIYIYHRTSIEPKLLISLIHGANPDCAGHPLTFMAFPKNGGTTPAYQWFINGVPVAGADSVTFTRYFADKDTISCEMVSNSPCFLPYSNTVVSNIIPVVHTHLLSAITITNLHNPICSGGIDTFYATIFDPGVGSSVDWYVSGVLQTTVVGYRFITSTLVNGDLVYAVLRTPDPCALTDTLLSNIINMTVIPLKSTSVTSLLTHGSNPGCIDSSLTYAVHFKNFGFTPVYEWLLNGVTVSTDTVFTGTFKSGDILTFRVNATDHGCYTHDTLLTPQVLMIRDSTPAAPLLSLESDLLINNMDGRYRWYFSDTQAYLGVQIGGASGKTYHPPSSLLGTGWYYTILDTGNCPSAPSNLLFISLLEVKNVLNTANVKLYPNPTTGVLNMDWNGRTVNAKIDIYNIVGQAVIRETVIGKSHHETDVANLPEGNYMVVLKDDDDGSTTTYKIYVRK